MWCLCKAQTSTLCVCMHLFTSTTLFCTGILHLCAVTCTYCLICDVMKTAFCFSPLCVVFCLSPLCCILLFSTVCCCISLFSTVLLHFASLCWFAPLCCCILLDSVFAMIDKLRLVLHAEQIWADQMISWKQNRWETIKADASNRRWSKAEQIRGSFERQ